MLNYIHKDPEFQSLLQIVAVKTGIQKVLIEKDYWIMHVLHGLQKQGIAFELKGGTSLSKGYGTIHRFSEDIDISVCSHFGFAVSGNAEKKSTQTARKAFYDHLANSIAIDGIMHVIRDHSFDDVAKYRSGGIRLIYQSEETAIEGLKSGILLEVGFDQTAPNEPKRISSWVWDHLVESGMHTNFLNNTADKVPCYLPQYTLVEKLQTIVRKYRNMQGGSTEINFMRQYYDVYCLLERSDIIDFLSSKEYLMHKAGRIKGLDAHIPLNEHPAFLLEDTLIRAKFKKQFQATASLYFRGQPDFEAMINRIQTHMHAF